MDRQQVALQRPLADQMIKWKRQCKIGRAKSAVGRAIMEATTTKLFRDKCNCHSRAMWKIILIICVVLTYITFGKNHSGKIIPHTYYHLRLILHGGWLYRHQNDSSGMYKRIFFTGDMQFKVNHTSAAAIPKLVACFTLVVRSFQCSLFSAIDEGDSCIW